MLNIKTNSKLVKKGDTFVAIKGNTVDGHDFIDEAVKNGATKIVSEKVNSNLETILVKDTKKYLNDYLVNNSYKYGFILRYPRGSEYITGYMFEDWHFRYLGVELATKVFNSGLTYDEYIARGM